MNITRQDVNELNAVLTVTLSPEDYQDQVKNTLEGYRKSAKIPGFRPGHVPFGLIQKQYGKAVLAEELNKTVNSSLNNYILENKLEILGNPIPKEGNDVKGDFNNPEEFEFQFELGLAPEVKVSVSGRNKYDYLKVKIDEALINKQLEDLRRRYGKLGTADTVEEKDMVLCQFVELNDDDSVKEGGVLHTSTVSMEFVEDKKTKKALTGKKIGDKLNVNPEKVSKGEKDMAAMLGVKPEELANISKNFQITINEIKRMELAELNQELFDKLFGEGEVTTEEELRERVAKDLEKMFEGDADRLLTKSIFQDLVKKAKLDLPDDFLKRWIKLSNQKPISEEQIEQEYAGYAEHLKLQLVQGQLIKDKEIKLEQKDLIDFTKGLIVQNYAQYGMPTPEDAELEQTAQSVLQNKEEANRIFEMMTEDKLKAFFKETVKLNEKAVSYDDFVKAANS